MYLFVVSRKVRKELKLRVTLIRHHNIFQNRKQNNLKNKLHNYFTTKSVNYTVLALRSSPLGKVE